MPAGTWLLVSFISVASRRCHRSSKAEILQHLGSFTYQGAFIIYGLDGHRRESIILLQFPCQVALEIMRCHNSLPSTSIKISIVINCHSHRAMLSKMFSLCLPLALIPSIFAVVTRCSKLCLLITGLINRAYCVLILSIRVALLLTSINTLSLVSLAVHGIFCILRKKPHFRCLNSFFNTFAQ